MNKDGKESSCFFFATIGITITVMLGFFRILEVTRGASYLSYFISRSYALLLSLGAFGVRK